VLSRLHRIFRNGSRGTLDIRLRSYEVRNASGRLHMPTRIADWLIKQIGSVNLKSGISYIVSPNGEEPQRSETQEP